MVAAMAVSGAAFAADKKQPKKKDYRAAALEVMKASFQARGQATLDRLNQDEAQAACSRSAAGEPLASDLKKKMEEAQSATVKYPADSKYLGSWKSGERIAQTGRGLQFSDDPSEPAGGNCYACHQLSQQEVAYGTIGPSLYRYGKLRGNSEPMLKYTWAKLWNAQAFNACSDMPRFGHKGILTEEQLKDVMALLFDPESPVNQ
ncbi:MAG: sulfur oxidation c-type cytochrome SoxX [Myxococcaceae bacterium]|nr:sulfur oxidation c-type cytochrome SoxX [Myxococcaceae bacterium]